ncbi:hypothetical protein TRVA0_076S00144 [Trichomonascus vanleenenianus]|uniref:uncharacterized protein n=1 Tax=Trichomonascus vanleenenianus TaxID=2268995 RepID=UPI003ECB660C
MRAKYGVDDCDFYNLDETGLMIGLIRQPIMVKLDIWEAPQLKFLPQIDRFTKGLQSVSHKLDRVQAMVQVLEEANTSSTNGGRLKGFDCRMEGLLKDPCKGNNGRKGWIEEDGCVEEENEGSSKRRRSGLRLCGTVARPTIIQRYAQKLKNR